MTQEIKITVESTSAKIDKLFTNFAKFLKEKNYRYGDSALNPANIFSPMPATDQIKNRLDDKLNRIKVATSQGIPLRKNDVADVFGYVALLLIANDWLEFQDLLD